MHTELGKLVYTIGNFPSRIELPLGQPVVQPTQNVKSSRSISLKLGLKEHLLRLVQVKIQ